MNHDRNIDTPTTTPQFPEGPEGFPNVIPSQPMTLPDGTSPAPEPDAGDEGDGL